MDGPIRDTGISIVYEPKSGSSVVDIVIVHGLQGHPYKTWACKGPRRNVPPAARLTVQAADDGNISRKPYHRGVPRFSGKSSRSSSIGPDSSRRHSGMSKDDGDVKDFQVFWPKDLLPVQYPNARVLVYGYDTRVTNYLSGPTNENSIHSHGKDLLCSLAASRKLDSPLILIAHSLGGIVVKEMLGSSSNSTEDRLKNVVASTAAVIFLGTPHSGSADLAKLGDWARSMISAFRVKTNPAILDALRLKTNDLARAQESFSAAWSRYDFRVKTFQEGLGLTGLNFGPFGRKVVPDTSSRLGDIRERAETIQANHMEMCRFRGLDDPNYARVCGEITSIYDRLAGLNGTTAHRVDKQSTLPNSLATARHSGRDGGMGEREKKCLQSLVFPTMNQRAQNLESPAEGTCSWFFNHEMFVDWLTNKNQSKFCGLLCLKGKPGSGKSTLLKEAFFRSAMDMSGSECHIASFFFNAKGEEPEHSAIGMLRSILHQICSLSSDLLRALSDMAQSRRTLRGEDMAPWEEAELRAFFKSAVVSFEKGIVIFIDAIDECDPSSMRDVVDFWRATTKTAHCAGVQLSVCLSSRHFPTITINDCPEIIMEDHNHPDIVDFVGRRLDRGMSGKLKDRRAIQWKILEKSGGVFLWVSLVVKDVLRRMDEGRGLKALLKDLDSVPRELEDLFRQLLCTGPSTTMVVRMFQWALLPAKPLRLHEWHHILAFIEDTPPSSLRQWRESDFHTATDEQLEKRITHLSRGLLDFNVKSNNYDNHESADESMSDRAGAGSLDLNAGETRAVQVIHESVRQYFMDGPGFAFLNPTFADKPLGHAHLSMMNVCLDYILIAELDALVEARERAQQRVGDPYDQEENGQRHNKEPDQPRILARRGSATSVASFGSASSHHGTVTPVKLKKTQHQLDKEVTRILAKLKGLQSTSPIERRDDSSVPPALNPLDGLSGFVREHAFTRNWLNDQSVADEAFVDVPAAHASHQNSVTGGSQVLEDYPALLSYATYELFTHARKADAEDLDPSGVVKRLHDGAWDRWKALREGVDERIGLLYFAAELGLSSWLKADVWAERQICTAIELAVENKNAEVFGKLLGAFPSEICVKDTSSMILSLAVAADAALLRAFLSRHPLSSHELASRDKEGRTALHLIAIRQNIAGLSVLLEHGADVSAVDDQLRTALHLACMNQSRITDMLTEDFSTSDGILAPRSDIIKLLLDYDADIDAADEDGWTPLMVACSNRPLPLRQNTRGNFTSNDVHPGGDCFDVIEVLLKRGANAMKKDRMNCLPLHAACGNSSGGRHSKVLIARKLLDCGSPVNAEGVGFGTPLHVACYSSDIETVKELLCRGADTSLRDYHGRSPLHIATVCSTEQVVETLLSSPGTSVGATDNFGSTPLHLAYPRYDSCPFADTLAIIGRLLAHGAKADTPRNHSGDLPVDVARRNRELQAARNLQEAFDWWKRVAPPPTC